MNERCEITDLLKDQCAHCMGWFWDEETQQYVKERKPVNFTFDGLLKEKK